MFLQIWILPLALLVVATLIAFPLSRYLEWIMDGRYRPLRIFQWIERLLDSDEQNWKQYTVSLLVFNVLLFIYGYVVLALQPLAPLNPDGKGMIFPTTIFEAATAFMTTTTLQHYIAEQVMSNFSQIFFGIAMQFLAAASGLCALLAIIRALRGDSLVGNYFVDMWRTVIYVLLPLALIVSLVFIQQGSPMTFQSSVAVSTLEPRQWGPRRRARRSSRPLWSGRWQPGNQ